jgi:hypothetical protein
MSATLQRTDHVGDTVSDLDRTVRLWARLPEREPKARKSRDVPYPGRVQGCDGARLDGIELRDGKAAELVQLPEGT